MPELRIWGSKVGYMLARSLLGEVDLMTEASLLGTQHTGFGTNTKQKKQTKKPSLLSFKALFLVQARYRHY